jgi:UDPglucose 6-dehydrogenase
MRVGIIGCGFVGKALAHGIKSSASILEVDPRLGTKTNDLLNFKPNIIFICVPTPLKENLTLDASIVYSVIDEIVELNIDSIIVLKSTILPDHLGIISKKIKRFIYNPEFLREKSANEDFINSNLIVFGGEKKDIEYIRDFYSVHTKCNCKEYVETDIFTASLIKYSINTFLATKVSFFNELKSIFKYENAEDSWDKFTSYLNRDPRMGNSHMSVPGHDGKEGFGGACLPKDSYAFFKYFQERDLDFSVLKAAINVNNTIRGKYNNDPREKEQKISFNKKIT